MIPGWYWKFHNGVVLRSHSISSDHCEASAKRSCPFCSLEVSMGKAYGQSECSLQMLEPMRMQITMQATRKYFESQSECSLQCKSHRKYAKNSFNAGLRKIAWVPCTLCTRVHRPWYALILIGWDAKTSPIMALRGQKWRRRPLCEIFDRSVHGRNFVAGSGGDDSRLLSRTTQELLYCAIFFSMSPKSFFI